MQVNALGLDFSYGELKIYDHHGSTVIPLSADFDVRNGLKSALDLRYGIDVHFASYGITDELLEAYVCVPADLLTDHKKPFTIYAIRDWLIGGHDLECMSVEVGSVVVRSISTAAMYDMIYSMDGRMTSDARYATVNAGVISICADNIELSGMLSGKASNIMMFSGKHDQTDRYIVDFVDATWGKISDSLNRVIAVGSGAELYRSPLLSVFGDRLWIPDSPIIAASRGLYKRSVLDSKRAAQPAPSTGFASNK